MPKDNLKRKRSMKKVFYTLLLAFAIVSFWRGAWGLMDLYLLPNNPFASFMVSLAIGIVILYSTENLIRRLV